MSAALDPLPAGIGVVAPHDFALDRELLRWVPGDVSIYTTRTSYVEPTGTQVERVRRLADLDSIADACRSIATPGPEVVAYLCTSCTFVQGVSGDAEVQSAMVRSGVPNAITTSSALLEAVHALGISRIGIATPYGAEATQKLRRFLGESDVEVLNGAYLDLTENIWRVSSATVEELAVRVPLDGADALFISCTNLPTYDIITRLEHRLGVPVLSANMVTMWAALRVLDRQPVSSGERLFGFR